MQGHHISCDVRSTHSSSQTQVVSLPNSVKCGADLRTGLGVNTAVRLWCNYSNAYVILSDTDPVPQGCLKVALQRRRVHNSMDSCARLDASESAVNKENLANAGSATQERCHGTSSSASCKRRLHEVHAPATKFPCPTDSKSRQEDWQHRESMPLTPQAASNESTLMSPICTAHDRARPTLDSGAANFFQKTSRIFDFPLQTLQGPIASLEHVLGQLDA